MKPLMPILLGCFFCTSTLLLADDEAKLTQAMATFNNHAKAAQNESVLSAVSQQTGVSPNALQRQMKKSHLGYGELIAANSLVEGGGKSLENVLALKTNGKGWASLSRDLKIDPNSIVTRVRNADKMLQAGAAETAQTGAPKKAPLPGFTDVRVVRGIGTASNREPIRQ